MSAPIEGFRHFKPAGPVSAAFIKDHASIVKALLGPVGGGKSVANVYDCIRRPSMMPACNDGIVRYRRAIVGSTYGQIERNLYPTWWRWLPKDTNWTEGEWEGGGGRFAKHMMAWDAPRRVDGEWKIVEVRAEYIFAAIGDLAVEEFMRGFEPTDFWLYEVDQLPASLIGLAITRLRRYPATGEAPDAIPADVEFNGQIGCDLNAPDVDSWFYEMFEENPPAGFRLYKQPSGRSPRAENLANLPRGYYDLQVATLSKAKGGKNLVKRMVDAQYAPSSVGEPVYADEYDDDRHLAPEILKPLPNVPITLGFDQGLGMPAMVGGQKLPNGQLRVLFECVPGRMSARRFANACREVILDVAPGVRLAEIHYCDPAGFDGADREDGESAWADIVMAELGIVIQSAETNELSARLTAVADDLVYMIEPHVPAMLISPACKMLRKGFVSHYMYEKRPDEKAQNRKPIKNPWSNPHDALQYLELGLKGRWGVVEGRRDPTAPERQIGQKRRAAANTDCTVIKAPMDLG